MRILLSVFICLTLLCSFVPKNIVYAEENTAQSTPVIANGGFEDEVVNGNIPNWKLFWSPLTEGYTIEVTDEKKVSGNYSLKLVDGGSKSLGLFSNSISVTPGKTYTVSSNIFIEKGTVMLYLKFYNSAGKEVATPAKSFSSPTGRWTAAIMEGTAPADAVTAKVLLYSSTSVISTAYFDDVTIEIKETLELPFEYGAPVKIGPSVLAAQTPTAAIGNNEVYFATNGSPATFYVLDAETGDVKFSQSMPGLDVVWAATVSSDGNAYFSGTSNGILYRYLPKEKRIENLGFNLTDKWVWDIDASGDGKIYGATYPNAKAFEYDIASGTFKDLGNMYEGQKYARGCGVNDDYLYVGIGSIAHLVRIDRKTGEKKEIQLPVTGKDNMVSNIWSYNGKLFVAYGTSLCILDEATETVLREMNWQSRDTFDGVISPPSPYNSDLIYFRHKNTGELWTYNMASNEIAPVYPAIQLPSSSAMREPTWITLTSGPKAGRTVLAMLFSQIQYAIYDPLDNTLQMLYPDVEKQGVAVQSLEKGPDGKIYMGGYQAAMSIYDPVKKSFEQQVSRPAQIESIGTLNGKVYFGIYGGAVIYRYDPSQPYNENTNPGVAYDIQEEQSRPYTFTSGDNKLFIGTISDYGKLGGALTIYDEPTGKWSVYRNIVQDQSIIGLAYKDGKVYGGTTLWGGLGIDPTATEAKMFVWDVATESKLSEFRLEIPGIKTPVMIGELSIGPDGLLWGITSGYNDLGDTKFALFAMDPVTCTVIKSKVVTNGEKGSNWRPFALEWGQDGLLYTTIGRYLVAFDPVTLKYKQLSSGYANVMDLGDDGSIYYSTCNDSYLVWLPVPLSKVGVSTETTTINKSGSYELKVSGTQANGKPANLLGSTIEYFSSNPEVVSVQNGIMSANMLGTAEVWVRVTLNGVTVKSDILVITVTTSLEWIRQLLNNYEDTGDLEQPLAAQLVNSLDQAQHQKEIGNKVEAIKHLQDFIKHVENKAMLKKVSAAVQQTLDSNVKALISIWEKE